MPGCEGESMRVGVRAMAAAAAVALAAEAGTRMRREEALSPVILLS